MINRKRRLISGLLSGALGLTVIAQEPAAPAGDQFKAPANVAAAPAEAGGADARGGGDVRVNVDKDC